MDLFGALADRVSAELNPSFKTIEGLFELDDGYAVVGQRRPEDGGSSGLLIGLVKNEALELRRLPDEVAAPLLIRSWDGEPYVFWERTTTPDGGYLREVMTAPLDSFQRE